MTQRFGWPPCYIVANQVGNRYLLLGWVIMEAVAVQRDDASRGERPAAPARYYRGEYGQKSASKRGKSPPPMAKQQNDNRLAWSDPRVNKWFYGAHWNCTRNLLPDLSADRRRTLPISPFRRTR